MCKLYLTFLLIRFDTLIYVFNPNGEINNDYNEAFELMLKKGKELGLTTGLTKNN